MSNTVIELNTAAADLIAWLDCCGIESHFVENVRAKLAAQSDHHDPIGVAQDRLIAEQALAHCEAGPEYCQQCYKEAMKLALKALEPFTTPNWAGTGVDEANAAYTALQGALAKLAEQPAPAAREWVGLTDEERDRIWSSYRVSFVAIGHIESKLREKNT